MKTFLMYLIMCLFDFLVLAGTAYLVQVFDWSPWWFVLAFIMCMGSNPKFIMEAGKESSKE